MAGVLATFISPYDIQVDPAEIWMAIERNCGLTDCIYYDRLVCYAVA